MSVPLRRSTRKVLILSLMTMLGAACAPNHAGTGAAPTTDMVGRLEVINRSSSDMDIYLVRGGQRARIGLAPTGETTRFAVTSAEAVGVGLVRFEAVPRLGGGRPISSEPTTLRPDDVITLDIPPP